MSRGEGREGDAGGQLDEGVSGATQNAWVLFDGRYPLGDIPGELNDDLRLDQPPFALDTQVLPPVERRPIPHIPRFFSKVWPAYLSLVDDEPDEVAALEFFATLPQDISPKRG
jgi:hypothetical protein